MTALSASPSPRRRAVLLVNLGTPDEPTPRALRRYYGEFLSDPRVINLPWPLRWLLLNLLILPFRPRQVAPLYQAIWRVDGSPLLVNSRRLQQLVQGLLPDAEVVLAMRYGRPSLSEALERLDALNLRDVTVVPLFPHEASATTGSVKEAIYRWYLGRPRVATLKVVAPFFAEPGFVDAVARSVTARLPAGVEHVLFSYHGLPEQQLKQENGAACLTEGCCARNPHCYRAQCLATTRLVAARAGLKDVSTAFQSRLGPSAWIGPSVEEAVDALAARGLRNVALVTPGFVSDCLETLEELGVRLVERFAEQGGVLTVVPCLNDDPAFAAVLANLAAAPSAQATTSWPEVAVA